MALIVSPLLVEGVRERLLPGDWAPGECCGAQCGVQCGVGVVCVGEPLVIFPSLLVEGGRERLVEHVGWSEVVVG